MAKEAKDSADPFARDAKRDFGSRSGDPLFVRDTRPERTDHRRLTFSSSSPINAAALDGYSDMEGLAGGYDPTVLRRARRRRFNRLMRLDPRVARAVPFGLLSFALYALLFSYEQEVLAMSSGHGLTFLFPAAIALIFSYAHGGFTGAFWDAVGLKPNTVRK